mmetsp:Transcript_3735/g.9391  ORF Transcript_3735/g.9391 Transcript_3735/m.9391 type:complete len:485 (-) Transcript_3735:4709-6163(-)
MVAIQHLLGGGNPPPSFASSQLSAAASAVSAASPSPVISLLSWNVLLPNSVDGWWTYKMYNPPLSPEQRYMAAWQYRQDLIQQRISTTQPNIVCLQEVAPDSFEDDFRFLTEDLGYDGVALFNKGRFRPATFWKTSELELVAPPVHKDRTLLTAFRPIVTKEGEEKDGSTATTRNLYVLNCHLQAGAQAPRRVRQIHEGMRAIMTLARKLKEPNPQENLPILVCGDFNGGQECGAVHYLEQGLIDDTFVEDGKPVTNSSKVLPLATPMIDVMAAVQRINGDSDDPEQEKQRSPSSSPPPTMVVSELISQLVDSSGENNDKTAYEEPCFSSKSLERLERIYTRFATGTTDNNSDEKVMTTENVEQWLIEINGQVGRGSEFREAVELMTRNLNTEQDEDGNNNEQHTEPKESAEKPTKVPLDAILTLEDFQAIYTKELRQGKVCCLHGKQARKPFYCPFSPMFNKRPALHNGLATRHSDVVLGHCS